MARDRVQVIKPSLSLSHGLYNHGHRFKKHRLADPGTLGCASLRPGTVLGDITQVRNSSPLPVLYTALVMLL